MKLKISILITFCLLMFFGYSFKMFDLGGVFETIGKIRMPWKGNTDTSFVWWYWTLSMRCTLLIDSLLLALLCSLPKFHKRIFIPITIVILTRSIDVFQFIQYQDTGLEPKWLEVTINLFLFLTVLVAIDVIEITKEATFYIVRIPIISKKYHVKEIISENIQLRDKTISSAKKLNTELGPHAAEMFLLLKEMSQEKDAVDRDILFNTKGVELISKIGKTGREVSENLMAK